MRYLVIIIALFAALQTNAQNNIVYGAGINYTNGAPTFTPPVRTSRVAIDTVTGRWYHFNTPGGWQLIGNTIEEIAGCTAPAYTPGKGDSKVVINNCSPQPELYFWNGSAWVLVGGGSVYAGEGIRIENDTIILDSLNFLDFRTGNALDGDVGRVQWNDTDGTLDLNLKGGNVTLQIGQEEVSLVKHADNSGLIEGRVVYIVGSDGANKTVRYAKADSDATSATTFGLMTESATGGNKAFCTTFGLVRDLNTTNLTEGGIVWLSADTAGTMTAVRPTAPDHGVMIGFCVRKHATQGAIFVQVQNGYELNELHDVFVPSPTNGQVLTWNSTNARWEAITPSNQLQTLSTDGSAGNISISSGNTITLNVNDADASATNELQTLSVAANTATLSNSGGSVTIAGAGINTVGTAGTTITVTGTEVDGSTTNELQTLSTGTNTLTLSNGGGTVTVDTNPADDLTGSGASGQVSFWTGAQTQGGDNAFFWNNTDKRLGVNTSTPSTTFEVQSTADAATIGASNLASNFASAVPGDWTFDTPNNRWVHTIGNTTNLTATVTNITGGSQIYRVVVTIANRTAGSITVSLKGSGWPVALTATSTLYFDINNNNNLIVRPTSDFNGAVSVVVNSITAYNAVTSIKSSSSNVIYEQRSTSSAQNIFQGVGAGGFHLSGSGKTFIGAGAGGLNTTGVGVAIGSNAARSNTTGSGFVAIGSSAGFNSVTGINWFALGGDAGFSNVSGNNWIALGTSAARFNRIGANFVAIGERAAFFDTTATSFIAVGPLAAFNHLSGNSFTAIGSEAAAYYIGAGFPSATDFSNGVYIGHQARVGAASATNELVLGFQAAGLGSNQTVIGNANTTRTWLGGSLTLGTQVTPAARLHVVGSGNSSSTWTAQFHNSAGNNNALMIRDDGNVGVGTSSPGARLQINGSGLTSSTNSLRLVDNNSTQYFNAADDGQLTIGKNVTLSTASTYRVFQGNPTITNTVSGGLTQDVAFFSGGLTYAGSEPFSGARAMQFSANNRNTATSNQIWGAYFVAQNETTTARADRIRGMDILLINNATGGTIGEVSGLTVRVPTHAVGSTITNTIGVNILDLTPTTAGTQTNVYSISSSDINARMYHAGQIGVGTTSPNASAALDVTSTTQGVLFPRMTTTQRDAIASPADGLVIYNTTDNKLQVRAGGAWVDLH